VTSGLWSPPFFREIAADDDGLRWVDRVPSGGSQPVSATIHRDLVYVSVATHQTAACWVVVTEDGRFAYTTNTGSGSISGYEIDDGALTLLNADGRTADTAVLREGRAAERIVSMRLSSAPSAQFAWRCR
jgi:hypothetical protein